LLWEATGRRWGEEEVLVNDVFVRNFVQRYFGGVEIKLIMLTCVAVLEEV